MEGLSQNGMGRKGGQIPVEIGKLEHDNLYHLLRGFINSKSVRDISIQNIEKIFNRQLLIDHNFGGFIHSSLLGG